MVDTDWKISLQINECMSKGNKKCTDDSALDNYYDSPQPGPVFKGR